MASGSVARWWAVMGGITVAVLAISFVVERCYDQWRLEAGGWLEGAWIVSVDGTTTVLVEDSIRKRSRHWRTHLVAVDGATGDRLATRTSDHGRCRAMDARGRVSCFLEGEPVRLDARTLEVVDADVSEALRGSWTESTIRCDSSTTVQVDGEPWGFAGTGPRVFARLPVPAEGPLQRRTWLIEPRVLLRDRRVEVPHRIGDDVLVQHRTTANNDAGYLLSRIGLDGVARWTVPLDDGCAELAIEAGRVIVVTGGTERALAIEPHTGVVLWRLRFGD